MTTPSGILVTAARVKVRRRRKVRSGIIPKIVAYLSCSAGRTHFLGPKSQLVESPSHPFRDEQNVFQMEKVFS